MTSLYVEKTNSVIVSGPDSVDFLQRLTTQDFKHIKEGDSRWGALLSGTSHIKHLFSATLTKETFVLSVDAARSQALAEDLEKMHFAENLQIEVGSEITQSDHITEDKRIENGLFKFGVDITEKSLLLEAPLKSFLSRDKGCYPGQEVVERVFTYGQVAKKLVGIKLNEVVQAGDPVMAGEKKIGVVTSASPRIALAMIQKPFYQAGTKTNQGEIFLLPDSF